MRSFNFSSTTNILSRWVFPSPFNLDNCTVNFTTETEGIYWEKAALNPLESRWSVPFEFSFGGRKTRFTHAIAANKPANSHNLKIKFFFLLTRSLIDRCQIVTDTCKNNVSKFVWKPFKLSLRKWKCIAEASLLNLHHLYFNYQLLAQKLFSLWKILPYLEL